nr:cytochrome P450 [Tanacetum cinerariifolium]
MFPSLETSILSVVSLFIMMIFICSKWILSYSNMKKNLPPSPFGLPIIGNLHQLGLTPHQSLRTLAHKYGSLMLIHLGSVPVIVASSAEAAQEIMKTHDLIFSTRPKMNIASIVSFDAKIVAFSPYGEHWRQSKSVYLLNLLSTKRVQSFRRVREDETNLMLDVIGNSCGSEIDLSNMIMSLTNDVVCRIALGQKYYEDWFKDLMKELMDVVGVFSVGNYVPSLSWVDRLSGLEGRAYKAAKQLDAFLEGVVKQHETRSNESMRNQDVVDILLETQREQASAGTPFQRDTVKALTQNSMRPKSWFAQRRQRILNADEFKPERFLDSNIDYKGLHFELLPFGAGRRGCPGIQFAMSVNKLALASDVGIGYWVVVDISSPGDEWYCWANGLEDGPTVGDVGMISKKARILKLKRIYFEDYCSDILYAVSIKEDTAYLCLEERFPLLSQRDAPAEEVCTADEVKGEGPGTPTEPHHTPFPEAEQSPHIAPSSPSQPTKTTEPIPTVTPSEIPTLKQYSRRARISQSLTLSTAADEPASPFEDDNQGEAFLTVSGLEAEQDRENIIKTSVLPHDSPPRVTSLAADEGSMQHKLQELTALCTRLQRHQTEMVTKIVAQDLEITSLKTRIKLIEDRDGGGAAPSREDATIKGMSLETGKGAGVEKSTERGSNDTEELVNVLTSLDAANILTSGVQVVSVPPAAEVTNVSVPTGSGLVPTASPIFTTASVVTPYSRRKGKEKMVESDTPKKKKLQEQIDIARDAEIARIHAEEELQMLIDGLDRNNETIAKYLQEYEQFSADLSIGEKIDMINKLVKYQDHYAKVLKYQSQQRKPLFKKQQRELYMSIEDFVLMASKEEGERVKRKGLRLEHESAKKMKTSEEVSKEDLKEMMQLVPVEEVYVEALQVKHPISDWEIYFERQRTYWKIIRLGGHTDVYQFFVDMLKHFDREDLT